MNHVTELDPHAHSVAPKDRRRKLRVRRNPVQQLQYRKRRASDTMKDLTLISGEVIKGEERCRAIGLPAGDCRERRHRDAAYCFYHDKLQRGLTTPTADVYPVWPLPETGYVLEEEVEQSWVA